MPPTRQTQVDISTPHLSQVVCNEVLLVAGLAPKHHDTLHEGHPVDLQQARQSGVAHQQREEGGGKQSVRHAKSEESTLREILQACEQGSQMIIYISERLQRRTPIFVCLRVGDLRNNLCLFVYSV